MLLNASWAIECKGAINRWLRWWCDKVYPVEAPSSSSPKLTLSPQRSPATDRHSFIRSTSWVSGEWYASFWLRGRSTILNIANSNKTNHPLIRYVSLMPSRRLQLLLSQWMAGCSSGSKYSTFYAHVLFCYRCEVFSLTNRISICCAAKAINQPTTSIGETDTIVTNLKWLI